MTVTYKGYYKDSTGTREIEVENDFNTLIMEIEGVVFSGSELDDMSIVDKSKYTDEQLARFTFCREALCNCSFEIVVPQVIIDRRKAKKQLRKLSISNN